MKKSVKLHIAFFLSLALAGCNKSELSDIADVRTEILKVNVAESTFMADEPESKAAYDGKSMSFEKGDRIGIHIVKDGTTVLQRNIAVEFNGTEWQGTVYYYEGADYIAYYPYDETMGDAVSVDGIKAHFADNRFSNDQSSKESYRNCDLMVDEIEAMEVKEGGNLNFSLSHTMSLIEFAIPVYSYRSSDGADAYSYGVLPDGLKISIGNEEYVPFNIGAGLYRCIVSPSADGYAIAGSFNDMKSLRPVNFTKDAVQIAENEYRRFNVTYQDAPAAGVTVRPIEVGDYYYADGNIVPNDFTVVPTDGCIGIIFSTSTQNELALDGSTVCRNGYVLSLKNATGNAAGKEGTWDYSLWSSRPSDFAALGLTPVDYANMSTIVGDNNGYTYTKCLLKAEAAAADGSNLKHALETYGIEGMATEAYAAPQSSTGWFVPSVGQFISVVRNLGGMEDFDGSLKNDAGVFDNLNAALGRVGGVIDTKTDHGKFWTSNVGTDETRSATGAYLVELKESTGKCEVWVGKDDQKYRIRPVLAF